MNSKHTEIYSVFPACGKTWLFNNQDKFGVTILDSDSSEFSWCMRRRTEEEAKAIVAERRFTTLSEIDAVYAQVCRLRNPDFPKNYIEHIKDKIGTCDYIFVSSHKDVRSALYEAGIQYSLVYPDNKCKAEWIGRCYLRDMDGNNGFPIPVLVNNWDTWITQCDEDPGASEKIILGAGEFLADYFPEHEIRS